MEHRPRETPGSVLRGARQRARLSQNDLARRAGVAQSAVSAYESGRRTPTLATLERLVAATGHELVLSARGDGGGRRGLPDTPLGRRLRQRRRAICASAARHGVRNVRVFGSVARGEEQMGSDVDLVVDVVSGTGLFELESLRRELSDIVGASVDVVPFDSLRERVRHEIERDAVAL